MALMEKNILVPSKMSPKNENKIYEFLPVVDFVREALRPQLAGKTNLGLVN